MTSANVIGQSLATLLTRACPRSVDRCLQLAPWGSDTFILTLCSETMAPCGRSVAETTLLPSLSWHDRSDGRKRFTPLPMARSTLRMSLTICPNSSGSKEQAWSVPFHRLSRVICLSITWKHPTSCTLQQGDRAV